MRAARGEEEEEEEEEREVSRAVRWM